jgi:hypothetical protein
LHLDIPSVETALLFETGINILTFFLTFMLGKDFVRVLGTVGLGVNIHNVDIDYGGVSAMGILHSTAEKVSMLTIVIASGVWVGDTLNRWLVLWVLGLAGCGAVDIKGLACTANGVMALQAKLLVDLIIS